MKEQITAADFQQMILSAAAAIENNRQVLNEMNVFPVPDGDTGVNMSMTINAADRALSGAKAEKISAVAETAASALLRGARGNSGVILSLLFRGFSKACAGKAALNAEEFASALTGGVNAAYRAVMKPAEGTILTVSRKAAEAATASATENADICVVLEAAIAEAQVALADTMNLNPVLKKAGVVDAGGKGWVLVLEAMDASLKGSPIVREAPSEDMGAAAVFSETTDEEILFAYCTEYIINRSEDGKKKDPKILRAKLESIGDCVVVVDDEEIIKVHVHTNQPDIALKEALTYGELVNIKIENMREQHTQKVVDEQKKNERTIAAPEKPYGFVVVAAGEGICNAYRDLGVDRIVEGGQTMNPSTEDILSAIDATPAETVFVLPNNKNIIMAAQQTVDLSEKRVVVLETKHIPQGISAMLAFDPDADVDANTEAMSAAAASVTSGSITYAARDSEFDGNNIKKGEYLALCEGKLSQSGKDLARVMETLGADMKLSEHEFITVFYGEEVSAEDAAKMEALCKVVAPNAEVMLLEGNQPVYYYIISAE